MGWAGSRGMRRMIWLRLGCRRDGRVGAQQFRNRTILMTKIIAHRGVHSPQVPENTIAAFTQAINLKADMIEFDVRTTKDQIHIICHDPKVAGRPIHKTTWAEIQTLNPQIPTLEVTLKHCQNRIPLDVEIKESGHELAIVTLIKTYFSSQSFVITSFNLHSLQIIRQAHPDITIGLLLERTWRDRLRSPIAHRLQSTSQLKAQIQQLNPDFLAPHHNLLSTSWLQDLNPTQIPYWVWTVNNPTQIQGLQHNSQITGIITDHV